MLFTEIFDNEDDEVCYDVDITAIFSAIEPPGIYKYKYDDVEYEDLEERDEFLEYCIKTLGQEDDTME